MESIRKEFPGVVANDDITLEVRRGEIHGLLGENGAGKSTLMKTLYGLYTPTSGKIWIDGEHTEMESPQDAIDAGIGMVHQHFKLIPRLTVAENIVLGNREPATVFREEESDSGLWSKVRSNGFVQAAASRLTLGLDVPEQEIQALADDYGFDIDVTSKIWELDIGQQQRVEILKALYRDVDLLILDEPTAVLTPTEAEQLFDTLQDLADQGLSIISITHKLTEVKSLTDRVTVLRDGEKIDTVETAEMTRSDLAEMMVGREVLFDIEKEPIPTGRPVVDVSDLVVANDRGMRTLNGIDFTVESGEVVGIAGVSGNGQNELAEALVGVREPRSGSISVGGKNLTGANTREFVANGVSFVPEDRNRYGAAGDLPIMHNAVIKQYRNGTFGDGVELDYEATRTYAETLVSEFDVRGVSDVEETLAKDLSGGNLQKLILAREIQRDPDFLVANQPTRGVDVGAIEFIREKLLEQRKQGTGILLISENLDEVFELSDRILVMYEGEIVLDAVPEEADSERVSLLMNGGSPKPEQQVIEKGGEV